MVSSFLRPGAIAALFSALVTATSSAAVFTGLYVFGDSLSDTGNAYILTGGESPSAGDGYYNGRYSNGPVWVETLATQYLNLPAPTPYLQGGTNYAIGGAPTSGSPTSLTSQAALFTETFDATDLVVVWAGANDLFDGGINADPVGSASNVLNVVADLAGKGAGTVLLLGLPNIGLTPDAQAQGALAAGFASSFSSSFNSALAAGVDNLESNYPGLDIILMDIFSLTQALWANPADFGLTNVTDPVRVSNPVDPSGYAYFDGVHPTTEIHAIIAGQAAELLGVPEPSVAGLVVLSATGMLARRRRTSALAA